MGMDMQGSVMIVTEFCDDGDLRSKLSSYEVGDTYLWKERGRQILLQVSHHCSAAQLHSAHLIAS